MGTVSLEDVAAVIRRDHGGIISRVKLLKLLYYAQGWSLVWDGTPLFTDKIEAWDGGPVVRSAWVVDKHSNRFLGSAGDPNRLSITQRETIAEVVRFYGQFDGETLSELTHRETPWRDARRAHDGTGPCRQPITDESMRKYFATIPTKGKHLPDAELKPGLEYLVSLPEDQVDALSEDTGAIDG